MSTKDVLDSLVTLLRAELTVPVEEYWRIEPPLTLTVYVQPKTELAEVSVALGDDFASGWEFSIIAEVPWDDKVSTGAELDVVVESIKDIVQANRQPITSEPYVMMYGEVAYQFVNRPGANKPVFAAIVPYLIRYPSHG